MEDLRENLARRQRALTLVRFGVLRSKGSPIQQLHRKLEASGLNDCIRR